jgi:hypothetical protein
MVSTLVRFACRARALCATGIARSRYPDKVKDDVVIVSKHSTRSKRKIGEGRPCGQTRLRAQLKTSETTECDAEVERTVVSRAVTPDVEPDEATDVALPMATGESVPGQIGEIPADAESALSD